MRGYTKYFNIISIVLIFFVIFAIIWNFLTPILTSFIVAYLFFPFYRWLNRHIKNENISAFLICIILVIIFILPFAALITKATAEAQTVYQLTSKTLNSTQQIEFCKNRNSAACAFTFGIEKLGANEQLKNIIKDSMQSISQFIVQKGGDLITQSVSAVLSLFIVLFMTFYLLRDGKSTLLENFPKFMPLKSKHKKTIVANFDRMVRGLLFGQLIIAVVQGFVAGVGYFIFGVSSPVFWGLFTAFFALIPVIGTGIIWLPISLVTMLNGYLASDNTLILQGIGLMIYGFLLISTIDNVIRPKILGDRANIHPVIVLLGVFGGISLFGFIGFIIGPILLATCQLLLKIYSESM
ncbi:AI-2E family transporter [Candidatus Woesearchaeota archaeon]|nr:AI-2E family transporter [Candidatus Woesearchaeota archaeon]